MRSERFSPEEIARVKELQRLAYASAESVARGLEPGVTEIAAAQRLGAALRERGVDGFFHTPFAWFGDRTGFYGFRGGSWRRPLQNIAMAKQFFPTERRLERGMVAILDAAPIRDGLCADIGYSFSLGESDALARALDCLREVRGLVLSLVRAERTMREIYRAVDTALATRGYENAHRFYPAHVLGHKVGRVS